MLNQPTQGALRQPRGIVKIDGEILPWVSWQVDNNSFYQADTFNITLALSALPSTYDGVYWAARNQIDIEIYAGFPADADNYSINELEQLIYGRVDDVTFNPVNGIVELSGRDLTLEFIDAQTTEKWQNKTASQIAIELAERHGLTPVVTATTTKAGTYYEIDHARLNAQRSEWDLLTWLAHEEQFLVFVKGKELHFRPYPSEKDTPFILEWEAPNESRGYRMFNGKNIVFSRNLTLAKDVIVEVRSWNQKSKKAYVKKAQATHNKNTVLKGAAQPIGEAQVYSYVIPNLTPEAALQRAQSLLKQITAHEVKLTATMPAETGLDITNIIKVQGTGTAFDQLYYPDSIVRSMSIDEGYSMTINAKNHSPESTVTL